MRHHDVSQALFFPARPLRGIRAPFLRALFRPMAIACLRDLTRCLPERMWCISVRTERLPFAELFERRGIGDLSRSRIITVRLGGKFEETKRLVGSGAAFLHSRRSRFKPPRCAPASAVAWPKGGHHLVQRRHHEVIPLWGEGGALMLIILILLLVLA